MIFYEVSNAFLTTLNGSKNWVSGGCVRGLFGCQTFPPKDYASQAKDDCQTHQELPELGDLLTCSGMNLFLELFRIGDLCLQCQGVSHPVMYLHHPDPFLVRDKEEMAISIQIALLEGDFVLTMINHDIGIGHGLTSAVFCCDTNPLTGSETALGAMSQKNRGQETDCDQCSNTKEVLELMTIFHELFIVSGKNVHDKEVMFSADCCDCLLGPEPLCLKIR